MTQHLLLAFLLSAAAVFGADVTGKWSGTAQMTLDGQAKDDVAYFVFKQDGGSVTGSVGPNAEKQFPIRTGKIEGNKITLEATPEEGPDVIYLELQVDGDRITGTMHAEQGDRKMSGKLDVKREK